MSKEFQRGLRGALPIVLGYVPIGFAFGVIARQMGLTPWETLSMSLFVYAGASQFVAVSLWNMETALLTIVITTFLINLRHLLMSASLAPYLQGIGLAKSGFLSFGITDESYAVAISDFSARRGSWRFMAGTNILPYFAWATSTFLGSVAGSAISDPNRWGLPFALPAMFICLLILQLRDRRTILVAVASGVLSLIFLLKLPGNWNVLLATVVAATLGVILEEWKQSS